MPENKRYHRHYPHIRAFKAQADLGELMRRHGAHAIGIARKRVGGERTDRLALVFYVAAKRDESELNESEMIPAHYDFRPPGETRTRRVITDVVVSPPAVFEVDPETRIRPVPGGVSGGAGGASGTLGGWVWDTTDDTIVVLSNEHVLGTTAGVDIVQQSVLDGGSLPADKIGDVKRGIPRTTVGVNTVDCAIGEPDDSDVYELEVLEIGPAVYATDVAAEGMLVEKFGQTTEHTFGEVTDADYTTTVGGLYEFEDCVRIDAAAPSADWSAGGDSGSLVFAQEPIDDDSPIKPVVGLHFAGASTYGVVCKVQNVFEALDLTTLCAGAFSAFLDNLGASETETDAEVEREAERVGSSAGLRVGELLSLPGLRRPVVAGLGVFDRRLRRRASAYNPRRGLARDVQARLRQSRRGQRLLDGIDDNRGELLTALVRNGDVRRATIAALTPIVGTAVTTDDVLDAPLDCEAVRRFARLAAVAERDGSDRLRRLVDEFTPLLKRAEGSTLAELLGLDR